ncbi:hypothetical protein ACSSS7_004882 [Eimeria intestinalis]
MDHDGLLLSLARAHQGIGPLLETFFSFLSSHTDFFHILEEGGPSMGFAPAAAEAMVAEAFSVAQLKYKLAKQPHLLPAPLRGKSLNDIREITKEFNQRNEQTASRIQFASPACRLAVVASPPDFLPPLDTSKSRASSSTDAKRETAQQCPSSAAVCAAPRFVGAHKEGKLKDQQPASAAPSATNSCSPPTQAATTAATSRSMQEAKSDRSDRTSSGSTGECGKQRAFINPWNGAILDKYVWSQSINDATCQVRMLELLQQQHQQMTEVDSKLLAVTLRDDSVRIAYDGKVILEGKWCHPIQASESYWVLEQKAFVLLVLEKKRELWWDCLIQGDPIIDTTKVESVKKVEDFDEATQGHIRKIVYEQNLKRQGLKTPEEIQQENILRQAWDAEGSPFKGQPFDPNVLKPQNFGPPFPGT